MSEPKVIIIGAGSESIGRTVLEAINTEKGSVMIVSSDKPINEPEPIVLTNPYKDLPPIDYIKPFPSKKNSNYTKPKKKRKKPNRR